MCCSILDLPGLSEHVLSHAFLISFEPLLIYIYSFAYLQNLLCEPRFSVEYLQTEALVLPELYLGSTHRP